MKLKIELGFCSSLRLLYPNKVNAKQLLVENESKISEKQFQRSYRIVLTVFNIAKYYKCGTLDIYFQICCHFVSTSSDLSLNDRYITMPKECFIKSVKDEIKNFHNIQHFLEWLLQKYIRYIVPNMESYCNIAKHFL